MDDENSLTAFLSNLGENSGQITEAMKKGIDEEAEKCFEKMKSGTPVRTGALKASLQKTKVEKQSKYGWKIDYIGYDEHGQAYSKIARTLNKGGKSSQYQATHHIDDAIHLLKGMDKRLIDIAEKCLNGK